MLPDYNQLEKFILDLSQLGYSLNVLVNESILEPFENHYRPNERKDVESKLYKNFKPETEQYFKIQELIIPNKAPQSYLKLLDQVLSFNNKSIFNLRKKFAIDFVLEQANHLEVFSNFFTIPNYNTHDFVELIRFKRNFDYYYNINMQTFIRACSASESEYEKALQIIITRSYAVLSDMKSLIDCDQGISGLLQPYIEIFELFLNIEKYE